MRHYSTPTASQVNSSWHLKPRAKLFVVNHTFPPQPQFEMLPGLLEGLERDPAITAAWVGGSLAIGNTDAHSDIDLRLAVSTETFSLDHMPAPLEILERDAIFMRRRSFGDGTAWHYALLPSGAIWDVLVYRDTREPFPEQRRVIFARGDWAEKLSVGSDPSVQFPAAQADAILETLEQFWVDWMKHAKVLARGGENVIWMGMNLSRHALTRLKFIAETGLDCGATERLTIHTLLPVARALGGWSAEGMNLEELATEASKVGKALASRFGFAYPEAVEAVARVQAA
jgi:hypothetical protein